MTEELPPESQAPPSGVDAAAAETLEKLQEPQAEPPRRRGRPPGAKTKPKSAPRSAKEPKPSEESEAEKEASIAACALAGKVIWDNLAGPVLKCSPLTEEQAFALGAALDPVLEKYLPILGDWKAEVTLVVTIFSLYQANKRSANNAEWEEIRPGSGESDSLNFRAEG